jgi:hypothetical protein
MKKIILIFISLFILTPLAVLSQDQDTTLRVVTKHDGTEYIGVIISDDGREVLIETTALGKIYIPKSEIRSIVKVEKDSQIVFGEYRTQGPFTTRYAFTTNAHPVKKGENYAMINLYGPEIHFAVLDNLSIGLMSTWIASPMVLALKYSIPTKNPQVNFAVGTLMGTSGYLLNFRGFGGLHWGTFTYGSRMTNISVSAGYAYVRSGDNSQYEVGRYYNQWPQGTVADPTPALMFSVAGIVKVGAKSSLVFDSMLFSFDIEEFNREYKETKPGYYDDVTQNWIEPEYYVDVTRRITPAFGFLLMPGFRYQKTENRAFQISLSGVSVIGGSDELTFPFPMFSWYFRF